MGNLLSPITHPEAWFAFVIAGQKHPGVIATDGVQGFKRETEWDIKKGKGVKGGTLTLLQRPPAKGSFKILLWKNEHFAEWLAFLPLLQYDTDKTPAAALDIYYPSLASVDIDSVVVDDVGPIVHHGKGLYSVTVTFIEFFPPPPVSAVSTPTTATTTADPDQAGELPDPAIVTEQVLMSSLMAQANP